MTNTANTLPNPDPTKWSDRRREFSKGVYKAVDPIAAVTGVCAAVTSIGIGIGVSGASPAVTGAVVAAASTSISGVGIGVGIGVTDPATYERPIARKLGYAAGIAIPVAFGVATGVYAYDAIKDTKPANANKAAITAPALANACGDAAVQRVIQKLEDRGYTVTPSCK